MTDESNIGVILWFLMLGLFIATITGIDFWLKAHGHEYLTTEFREGLKNRAVGPFLAGGTLFVIGVFVWHMFVEKN